ncbi:SDR family oxidoreductase [Alkalimonas delamerensis]|uniref:SDR family oxidoreductase n=1 Tax=Alkalimonas delamerensis TaxID=265981 RepID=A0ABT9GMT4_9GAMM|nr:SDR family oxidoreductase [Alkalimonas delamerensis]MDP4528288.1 SDR family oxidoreductase [Alkalimonas delamerensis]
MNLNNKIIAITGGAQGLGLEMARMCAAEGARLALIDMNTEQLAAAKAELSASAEVRTYQANVANEAEVEATFAAIGSDFDGLDGLINNAGILRDGLLLKYKDGELVSKMPLQQFQSVIDVNLTGVFLCGREAAAMMVQRGTKGVIINMSSVARGGNMGQTNYAASKAGVVAMTVTWARELGRYGIRVGAIAPGVIRTAMTDAMKPEARERLEKMKPVGRLGEASEIAHTAKYIFDNDFFTGRVIEIDGGISM